MDIELKAELENYLAFLLSQPQTRKNIPLIDCTIHLMQELPDTEDSLHARD